MFEEINILDETMEVLTNFFLHAKRESIQILHVFLHRK